MSLQIPGAALYLPHWSFGAPSASGPLNAFARARTRAGFIYVGAEPSPAWPRKHSAEALDLDPGLEPVFRSGGARVYRVKDGR